jgi:hypothetical protein
MDENTRKYRKLEDLEFMEIDLRRQIGKTNELVKCLEAELRQVIREKNRLKTELEGIVYKNSNVVKDWR